jgi:hypothetical protein
VINSFFYKIESAGCDATFTATTSTANTQANTCPETGVAYLPDTESCNKYLICVNGSPFEKTCPRNLHFNEQTNACDQPSKKFFITKKELLLI